MSGKEFPEYQEIFRNMTLSQRIIARNSGVSEVEPGEFVNVKVDLVLANDVTAPLAINEFKRLGASEVFDKNKVVLVLDHFTPNRDVPSAEQCSLVREFARDYHVNHFYDVGSMGIEHVLLPEEGLVRPGELIVGADSHTCTYGALGAFAMGVGSTDVAAAMATGEVWLRVPDAIKLVYSGNPGRWIGGKDLILFTIGLLGVDGAHYRSLEFFGEAIGELSVEGRLTMANMVVEAGAKNGLFIVDEKTVAYLERYGVEAVASPEEPDDREYERRMDIDVSEIEPQVAVPPLPSQSCPVAEVGGVELDQVVIGSCTNGRLSDLEEAAGILKGRMAHPRVRLIVIPGSQRVYLEAARSGLLEVLVEAGAAVSTPTCGPCLGGHMGVLAKGERALATTNRNFTGRMGHPESEVYLSGPSVAAASAVAGHIVHPEEVVGGGEG